jgi:hypothetical protein
MSNTWASTGGSGAQTLVNGQYVDVNSPEARAQQGAFTQAYAANQAAEIKGKVNIERAKASLDLGDQYRRANESLSAQRVASAGGGSTRGMSRRVHRRRGPSAFAALGKLNETNRESAAKDTSGFYNTLESESIAASNRASGLTSSGGFATSKPAKPKFSIK